jgi:3-oxoacyl-[acyl-carrier protein] reductase
VDREEAVSLDGVSALVTGASRGIGRAIAAALAREGARVLALGRDAAALAALEREQPGRIVAATLDVTDRAQVDGLRGRVEASLGRLDVLVNNAGVWMERDFDAYTRAEWDLTIATNLTAVFDVTQACLPLLRRSASARVISIAAIDGEKGFPRLVAQCAAKAGVIGFTRALAKELWNAPITVNAICPAEVDKSVPYAATPARPPGPERALPWDVARAAVWLAGPEAVRVTGACLDVYGVGCSHEGACVWRCRGSSPPRSSRCWRGGRSARHARGRAPRTCAAGCRSRSASALWLALDALALRALRARGRASRSAPRRSRAPPPTRGCRSPATW